MAVSILPESAPFNEEQRAWLNGFFAGMLGVENTAQDDAAAIAAAPDADPPADEEEFPWHDSALDINERLKLAEGKPIERRMMAAMAQLDCGACGYVCKTYSEAIASGEEKNLTLCAPGGRETSKMLKKLVKETGTPGSTPTPQTNGQVESSEWSRTRPYSAKLLESRPLNGQGSAKDTRHVAIDLGESGIRYQVGDALGVYPTNCGDLANEIIALLGLEPDGEVRKDNQTMSLRKALCEVCCLKEPTEELLEELAKIAVDESERAKLAGLLDDDSELADCDVLDVLRMFPSARPSAVALVSALGSLNPRLYSIASSIKATPGQVHLTVGKVTWTKQDRLRKGVASTMLADRIRQGERLRVFIQRSHGFTVPADPDAPMIMVGPGTGIAPFIAFLQERQASGAVGKNWLFFGDQHRDTDFLYEQQLNSYVDSGLLTRLDVAFSRDQEKKIYVQDRMRDHAAEIWNWLQSDSYFFVCGDATRMAPDVDQALHEIVALQGNMDAASARDYIKQMSDQGRYARDIY